MLPDNHLGAELYPIMFRDGDGAPVNPGLPPDWKREPIGARDSHCPACGANAWDLVTAGWEGIGSLRNTRWGHRTAGPGRAFVCRVCGHRERLGASFTYPPILNTAKAGFVRAGLTALARANETF